MAMQVLSEENKEGNKGVNGSNKIISEAFCIEEE